MKKTLLIIDDDEDIRLILSSVLASIEDLTIVEADSGAAADQMMQNNPVSGIILDYQLPDTSGEELLKKICKPGLPHPKVIMLSAKDDGELTERWLSQGAIAVLKKPFNPFEILAQLRHYFEF